MEKVDEKWFKKHGWTCWVDETTVHEDWPNYQRVRHEAVYYKSVGTNRDMKNYKRARWEHTYERYYSIGKKTGKKHLDGVSNFYMFGSFGDGFEVKNNVSHRKFEVEKVEAALKLCGIE